MTQEAINWKQHNIITQYIKELDDCEKAVDKALSEDVITEKQAKIIKLMFGDGPQLSLAVANKMENDYIKSIGYSPKKAITRLLIPT